jgi:XRE family aerobic/anaerobic benzoate catabolism transcriptional regulator
MAVSPLLARVARRVRSRRHALGLTARELAERSGLSVRFVSQLENGQANIAVGRLDAVARVLGMELAELVAAEGWVQPRSGSVPGAPADARTESERREKPIALLGMRGAGKSTIGALLADALRWPLVEVDGAVEALSGLALSQIFTVHGEDYYRRLEAVCVGDLLGGGEAMVIAPSGGVVGNGPAFTLIRQRCFTVWLRASPEQHMARVLGQGDGRPMGDRERPMEELRAILARREHLYGQADLVLDTSEGSPEAAADQLVVALEALREEHHQLGAR